SSRRTAYAPAHRAACGTSPEQVASPPRRKYLAAADQCAHALQSRQPLRRHPRPLAAAGLDQAFVLPWSFTSCRIALHIAQRHVTLKDAVGGPAPVSDRLLATVRNLKERAAGTRMGAMPSQAESIASHLPQLRRFARLLTGSQQAGDAAVSRML